MKVVAVLFVALAALTAFAQEHAPLPAQCRADYDLWHADTKEALAQLTFTELDNRGAALWRCGNVVLQDNISNRGNNQYVYDGREYMSLALMFRAKLAERLLNYMQRHHEMAQFYSEDTAGQR